MRLKSNTVFSDSELRQIREAWDFEENFDAALYNLFPSVKHKIEGDVVYFGAPPWDITQEI